MTDIFDDPPVSAGYVRFPNVVLTDAHLSPGARVLYALWLGYQQHGAPVPSHVVLADALGVTPRHVRNFLKELRAAGLIPARQKHTRSPVLGHADLRADVWDKTGGRCWYCGTQTNPWRDFCVDHVVPQTQGGTMDLTNLVPACRRCNLRKKDRPLEHLRRVLAHEQGAPVTFYFEQLEKDE